MLTCSALLKQLFSCVLSLALSRLIHWSDHSSYYHYVKWVCVSGMAYVFELNWSDLHSSASHLLGKVSLSRTYDVQPPRGTTTTSYSSQKLKSLSPCVYVELCATFWAPVTCLCAVCHLWWYQTAVNVFWIFTVRKTQVLPPLFDCLPSELKLLMRLLFCICTRAEPSRLHLPNTGFILGPLCLAGSFGLHVLSWGTTLIQPVSHELVDSNACANALGAALHCRLHACICCL